MTDLAKLAALAATIRTAAAEIEVEIGNIDPPPPPPPPPTPGLSIPPGAVAATEATLAAVIAAGASDVVIGSGAHGVFGISGVKPATRVNIWFDPASHCERIVLGGGSQNLRLIAPRAWPDQTAALPNSAVIQADKTTSGIEVFRADVRGHVDADVRGPINTYGYALWTLAEWKARETAGVILEGRNSIIRECRGLGLRFAFVLKGAGSAMHDCIGLGLAEDGARIVGDGSGWTEDGCYFGDFVTTTGSVRHPDAIIQAWSVLGGSGPGGLRPDGTPTILDNMVITNNVCVELIAASGVPGITGLAADHPFRIAPQGAGFHDGSYSNLLIKGNRIWTSAWTGINAVLKRGSGAAIEDNECYDLLGRNDHVKITAKGAGITQARNIAGLQNYGAGQMSQPIDYATEPKPPAPPTWVQWA